MNRLIRASFSVRPNWRKLPDVVRHVVLPKDIVTTCWSKVEILARLCSIEYEGLQRFAQLNNLATPNLIYHGQRIHY